MGLTRRTPVVAPKKEESEPEPEPIVAEELAPEPEPEPESEPIVAEESVQESDPVVAGETEETFDSVGDVVKYLVNHISAGKSIIVDMIDGAVQIRAFDGRMGTPAAPAATAPAAGSTTGKRARGAHMPNDKFLEMTTTPEYYGFLTAWSPLSWEDFQAKAKKQFGLTADKTVDKRIARMRMAAVIQEKMGASTKWRPEYQDAKARDKLYYGE